MKKRLLPLALLLAAGLIVTGCSNGTTSASEVPSSSSAITYTVDITNKEELMAEWHLGESDRSISLTCSPGVVKDVLGKDLLVTSSNTAVVSIINNKMAHTVGVGEADIVATYHGVEAKVHVTVLDKRGEPQMIDATIKEVLAAITSDNQHLQKYHVSGEVKAWASGKTDGTKYGNIYINDGTSDEDLYVYGCTATATALAWDDDAGKYVFTNPQDFLTNAVTKDIKIGDTVEMEIDTLMYNTTKEGEGIVKKVTPATGVLPTAITVSGVPAEVEVGYYYPASLTFAPETCSEKQVTWTSSDAAKAGVDTKGGVYGVAAGEGVSVTATSVKAPTVSGKADFKVIANKNPECEPQALAAGQFKGGCVQSTNHKNLYVKASITDKGYIETTTKGGSEGLVFDVVANGEAFSIKVGDKFLGYDASLSGKIKLVDALESAISFIMVEGTKVMKTTIDEVDYTLATYGTYETFGLSKLSYVLDADNNVIPSQNPFHLYVKDAPVDPTVPEPEVIKDKTLAQIAAIPADEEMTKKYELSVKVSDLGSKRTGADKFGNMFVTDLDGENEITVYGATATASALAWDGGSKYGFKNPQDFLTNDKTKVIGVNDTLKIQCVKTHYNDTQELYVIVLEVTPGVRPALTGINVTGDDEVAVGGEVTLTASPVPYSATLGEVTWSVTAGADFVALPEVKTGASIKVTGVAEGEATIKATCGEFLKEFTLTVKTPAPAFEGISMTESNLGLGAYVADEKTATVDTILIGYTGVGGYGDGVQFRYNHKTTGSSTLYNKGEIADGIEKIVFNWNQAKSLTSAKVKVSFGTTSECSDYEVEVALAADTFVYTATPNAATYKYFKIVASASGGQYYSSIDVYFAD